VQALADTHDTLLRAALWDEAGFGLGTSDHLAPFQDSTSVLNTPALLAYSPTAVHALADAHDTHKRKAPRTEWLGSGLGTTDHLLPFQDSASGLLPMAPTAVQMLADTHDTP